MSSDTLSPLFTWRSAIADKSSGLPPTSRLVSLTLSLHMNERGGSCWPSVATLADETGLDERTVRRVLGDLREQGWLSVTLGGGRGHSNRYTATIPRGGETAQRGADKQGFTDRVSPERGAETTRKGGAVPPEDVIRTSRTRELPYGLDDSTKRPKAESDPRVGLLISHFVDTARAQGKTALTARGKVGTVGRKVKELLAAGVADEAIRAGIVRAVERSRPEILEDLVAEWQGTAEARRAIDRLRSANGVRRGPAGLGDILRGDA